jgi:hypothetical protein
VSSPVEKESAHSAAARRMRRHRARKRCGMRCVTTVLRKGQIERLIVRGLLPRDKRADAAAVHLAQHLALALGNV